MLGRPCPVHPTFDGASARIIAHDFKDTSALILHTCDTGGASSGSPLLIDGPHGPEVVGINVGTYLQSRILTQDGNVVRRFKTDTIANTAVSSTAFANQLAAFSSAVVIGGAEDIRSIQRALADGGYFSGPIDGVYGPVLREAITAFEERERRPVTGLATIDLQRRLAALRAEKARSAQSAASHLSVQIVETGSIEDKGGSSNASDSKTASGATRRRLSSP